MDPVRIGQVGPDVPLRALGVVVWPMEDQEADDALAAAAMRAAADPQVQRVFVCTPDKDLAQCVRADRIVQFDRRRRIVRDEAGVWEKFGVGPEYILVNLSVEFADEAAADDIETAIAHLDAAIKREYPRVKRVFVEAEARRR